MRHAEGVAKRLAATMDVLAGLGVDTVSKSILVLIKYYKHALVLVPSSN